MTGRGTARVAAAGLVLAAGLAACAFELGEVVRPDVGADAGADVGREAAVPDAPVAPSAEDSGARDGGAIVDASPCPDSGYESNPRHCGRCGHDCLAGACEAGICQPFVVATDLGVTELEAIVARKDVLYFAARQAIVSCPTSGCGDAGTVLASGLNKPPGGVAADDTYVYFAASDRVLRCPLGGCGDAGPVELASGNDVTSVAVDATGLYYTDGSGLRMCALASCNGTNGIQYARESRGRGLVLDGTELFACGGGGTNVYTCPVTGCPTDRGIRIWSGDDSYAVGVDGMSVFFTRERCTATDGYGTCTARATSIEACPRAGCGAGAPTRITGNVDTHAIGPFGLAVDATGVYFASDGRVRHVPKAGGTISTIFQGGDPRGVALDARGIYWTDHASPRVMGVAKP
jgi:hypothetical protein